VPVFTVHAEARVGNGESLVTDDIVHAGVHAIKHLTFPGVLIMRSCVITDESGFDVTPVLFKVVMEAASTTDGDLTAVPHEEIELAYRLQYLQYKRMTEHVDQIKADQTLFDVDSDSEAFETSLAQFLDGLAPTPTEDEAVEGDDTGQ